MRTTIELEDGNREALLKLAAERGERGFSGIVNEAVAAFVRAREGTERRRQIDEALEILDTFPAEAAERIAEHKEDVRSRWRLS